MIIALIGFSLAVALVITSATIVSVRIGSGLYREDGPNLQDGTNPDQSRKSVELSDLLDHPQETHYLRIHTFEHHARAYHHARKQQLALEMNPLYRAKQEEDRTYQLRSQKQAVELQLAIGEFQLRHHLAMTRVEPETYLLDYEPYNIIALPSLRRSVDAKEVEQPHPLPAPPTEDFLMSRIKENSFTISPGVRASNGEPVLLDITTVPHSKLIGASGFGKSTCMYIMLKQAVEMNDPRRLQLALLDLEHKTSRLLENYPHIASLRVGKRLVQMVATDADMVAEYLGYLKRELDRRTMLSEQELIGQPVLLIYVEEMLSLQYEVIDPKLLQIIFHSLTILSVRGRKYSIFLYVCMQTDYSTNELKISQKMFRFRGAAAVDTSAARAAGFQNIDLVKQSFQTGKPGQLVIEYPSFSDLVIVPGLELKHLLRQKQKRVDPVQDSCYSAIDTETPTQISTLHTDCISPAHDLHIGQYMEEYPSEARMQEVQKLRAQNWGKVAIIEKVWRVKRGSSRVYRKAEQEYNSTIAQLKTEITEKQGVQNDKKNTAHHPIRKEFLHV